MAASSSLENDGNNCRFEQYNDEEILDFMNSTDSVSTQKLIKFAVSVFRDFCDEIDDVSCDNIDVKLLDSVLAKFYAGARTKSGALYSKKSMQSIRFGLQRHFQKSLKVDIINDPSFVLSKKSFKALIKKLKSSGKANVKHHPPISKDDMLLIQNSLDTNTPDGLQKKVFIDVMIFFANRGMENLRSMKPADFILHEREAGDFYTMRDMHTKNHQDDDEEAQGGQMHSIPGNVNHCPVANMKTYLAKLNPKCEFMWQRPKVKARNGKTFDGDGCWYDNQVLGKNTLASMTKTISSNAGCSKTYTNHSLRATSISMLDHAGYASRDIMSVSGHRSETSIKNYSRTSETQKRNMSHTLSMIHCPTSSSTGETESGENETVTAEEEEPSFELLTDSQVEQIMRDIPNSVSVLDDITSIIGNDSPPQRQLPRPTITNLRASHSQSATLNMRNQQTMQPQYIFNDCTVNIYHI